MRRNSVLLGLLLRAPLVISQNAGSTQKPTLLLQSA
jgi:hypothetical protein